mgnify:CR=1 FL=1
MWSDEVTEQLTKLADLDSIAPEMLKSAAPIAVDALKQQVRETQKQPRQQAPGRQRPRRKAQKAEKGRLWAGCEL